MIQFKRAGWVSQAQPIRCQFMGFTFFNSAEYHKSNQRAVSFFCSKPNVKKYQDTAKSRLPCLVEQF